MAERETCLAGFFRPAPQMKHEMCGECIRELGGWLAWSGHYAAVLWAGPALKGPQILDATLLTELGHYHGLLERLRPLGTIVPGRFGIAACSEEELLRLMERSRPVLNETMARLEHKAEWDVTAQWNLDAVGPDLLAESEALRKQVANAQQAADRIHLGAEIASALAARATAVASQIREALFPVADEYVELGHTVDGIVLQAALLLDEDREGQLERALGDLDRFFGQRVNFRCVGPLPPLSFATVDIYRPEFFQLDWARKCLGLPLTVTHQEIQEAYRRRALETHPDHCPGDPEAQERFDQLKQAHDLLADYCSDGVCSLAEEAVRDAAKIALVRAPGGRTEVNVGG